eukprot:4413574-Pyramimonas_sp.AAC.1
MDPGVPMDVGLRCFRQLPPARCAKQLLPRQVPNSVLPGIVGGSSVLVPGRLHKAPLSDLADSVVREEVVGEAGIGAIHELKRAIPAAVQVSVLRRHHLVQESLQLRP